ncbi:MAG: Gfo/Idh/MocA family oxidoreductase [Isosphaeraceae bacterium]
MSMTTDRRSFLFGASVAGFGILAQGRRGWAGGVGPNETLNIACIGVGGKGRSDTENASHYGRIVAVCDIDEKRLDAEAEKYKEAKKYFDYRELLHELGPRIDAVTVSTPDHTHAPAAVMAMRMGKHVYCQKPLTHSVWEARLMRETARKMKVCTQMGNQGTANPGFRRGAEIVRTGELGLVREVHVWTNRPFKYWKQAPDIVARPKETPPVPKHIHWDLFLGTAPERPYNPVYHPHDWRGWWDFGTGSLGDMACHTANLSFMALGLPVASRVSAKSGPINSETYPAWATITYQFLPGGSQPPVTLTWYEGAKDGQRNLPPDELFPKGFRPSDSGCLLIGTKGQMYSPSDYGAEQVLWPEEKFKGYKGPERLLPRIEGDGKNDDDNQKKEWVEAIRAGKPEIALSNFDYASTLTESMLLGNVAVRSGEYFDYDHNTGQISGNPKAAQYLKPYFRKGWEI